MGSLGWQVADTERRRADRRAGLDQMTRSQRSGIYDRTPEDYAAALSKARRRAARPEDAS